MFQENQDLPQAGAVKLKEPNHSFESFLQSKRFEVLALFVVALVPRVMGLGIFLTVDEPGWLGLHTGHFMRAILSGDWAATYRRYHPAVTLMWMIAIGFTLQYLIQSRIGLLGPISFAGFLEQVAEPIDPVFLSWGRLPVALMTSACIMAIYLLLGKLFNRRVALLAAILLSLDPFYLAFCRLALPDAPVSSLVCVSLLSFMAYLWQGRRMRYLVFSGFAFGLALLTKSPAVLLAPVIVLVSLVILCRPSCRPQTNWRREGLQLSGALLLWMGIAGMVFFALWPAMWIAPVSTLVRMLGQAVHEAAGGWASFFVGRSTTHPPPWFYLVVLLIRTTPLTLVGFIAFLLSLLVGNFKANLGRAWGGKALALLTYVVIFTASMAMWANKAERFLLPIFPPICILAALGIAYWVPMTIARLRLDYLARARFWSAGIIFALLLQAGWSILHHPYYLSFYNPIFGGGFLIPKIIGIGLGEGLEQAARYLNVKGSGVRAASWYQEECFNTFFLGQPFPLSKGSVFGNELDYVVFYVNQVQRQLPDPQLVQCFQSLKPEHTVHLKGIDYAWIYRVPKPLPDCVMPAQYVKQTQFGDQILLLGYDVVENREPFDGKLRINLYWRALREMGEDYTVYLKLINDAYKIWGQQDSRPCWDGLPTNTWKKGQIVGDKREIDVLPGTPPGLYRVEIILYDLHSGQILEPAGGGRPLLGPVEIPRWESLSVEALGIEHPLRANLGNKISLLGYNIESGFRQGDNIHLTLFWQCLEEMEQSYTVFTHLVDAEDNIVAQKDNPPVDGFYPTAKWEGGEIVRDLYDLVIPSEVPSSEYRLKVGMYLHETGERLPIYSGSEKYIVADRALGLQQVIIGP